MLFQTTGAKQIKFFFDLNLIVTLPSPWIFCDLSKYVQRTHRYVQHKLFTTYVVYSSSNMHGLQTLVTPTLTSITHFVVTVGGFVFLTLQRLIGPKQIKMCIYFHLPFYGEQLDTRTYIYMKMIPGFSLAKCDRQPSSNNEIAQYFLEEICHFALTISSAAYFN